MIRPGAIGDVILSLPALESARADYTEVWAPRPLLPVIRFASRTRAIIDTGIELLGVIDGHRVPALEEFDSIYSWYGTQRPEFREAVAHLPFTFFPALPPPPGVPHIPVPPGPPHDFAVIHPFASSPPKRWPLEMFQTVTGYLGVPVRYTAGPEESLDNAVRFDDLYDLGCWLSRARLYIGNDSGIAHLAAAVGTPVVAVFLASDPAIWSPRGDRVAVLERPTVDAVLAASRRLLR